MEAAGIRARGQRPKVKFLDQQDVASRLGQKIGKKSADDAAADDEDVSLRGFQSPSRCPLLAILYTSC